MDDRGRACRAEATIAQVPGIVYRAISTFPTAASHVVHIDRWWNPAVENQATDRAFRIGQRRNVPVHKFMTSGTVEERIDEMIAEKRRLADDILAGEALMDLVRLDVTRAATWPGRPRGWSRVPAAGCTGVVSACANAHRNAQREMVRRR